jgi:hypothetical protein
MVAKAFQFLECTKCHLPHPAPRGRRCLLANKGLPPVVEVGEPDDEEDDVSGDTQTPAVHSEGLGQVVDEPEDSSGEISQPAARLLSYMLQEMAAMRSALQISGKSAPGGQGVPPNGGLVSSEGGIHSEGATGSGGIPGGMAKSGVVNGTGGVLLTGGMAKTGVKTGEEMAKTEGNLIGGMAKTEGFPTVESGAWSDGPMRSGGPVRWNGHSEGIGMFHSDVPMCSDGMVQRDFTAGNGMVRGPGGTTVPARHYRELNMPGPTLNDLRRDEGLCAQARQLVDDLEGHCSGTTWVSNSLKSGWFRPGGCMTLSRQVAWPHDYVFGTGEDIKIMYNDLNIFQWVQGFAALIDNEQNLEIKGAMLNHLELLMQDAQLLGWEATRYAHGVVLSKIEKGKLSWLDTFGISEARRSALNAKSGSIRAKQSNLNYQNFSKNGGFQNQASS